MTLSNRHLEVKSTFTVYKVRKVYQGLKVSRVHRVYQARMALPGYRVFRVHRVFKVPQEFREHQAKTVHKGHLGKPSPTMTLRRNNWRH